MKTVLERFGEGAIMTLGDGARRSAGMECISTGSINIDEALGLGGLPLGRIVEVYGPESSGKTTLTLQLIAQAQAKGHVCAFVDAEHALDTQYAQALGVKLEELLVSQPDHGEQALEIVDVLARTGGVGLIVMDSVAALVPRAELEGDMGDTHMGLQARLMSQAMRKIAGVAAQTKTQVVFINQLRHKIGVQFGSPETTTGGNALKYYASVRLDIRRIGSVKDGDTIVGNRVRVKVVKNKCAPPFRQAEVEIGFGKGIRREVEVLERAIEAGQITRAGSWFSMGEVRLGQGRNAALTWLQDHPEEVASLLSTLRGEDSTQEQPSDGTDATIAAPKKSAA
jgi:recombination protein RecA